MGQSNSARRRRPPRTWMPVLAVLAILSTLIIYLLIRFLADHHSVEHERNGSNPEFKSQSDIPPRETPDLSKRNRGNLLQAQTHPSNLAAQEGQNETNEDRLRLFDQRLIELRKRIKEAKLRDKRNALIEQQLIQRIERSETRPATTQNTSTTRKTDIGSR